MTGWLAAVIGDWSLVWHSHHHQFARLSPLVLFIRCKFVCVCVCVYEYVEHLGKYSQVVLQWNTMLFFGSVPLVRSLLQPFLFFGLFARLSFNVNIIGPALKLWQTVLLCLVCPVICFVLCCCYLPSYSAFCAGLWFLFHIFPVD